MPAFFFCWLVFNFCKKALRAFRQAERFVNIVQINGDGVEGREG